MPQPAQHDLPPQPDHTLTPAKRIAMWLTDVIVCTIEEAHLEWESGLITEAGKECITRALLGESAGLREAVEKIERIDSEENLSSLERADLAGEALTTLLKYACKQPEKPTLKHTPEPGGIDVDAKMLGQKHQVHAIHGKMYVPLSLEDFERAAVCVNACKKIPGSDLQEVAAANRNVWYSFTSEDDATCPSSKA